MVESGTARDQAVELAERMAETAPFGLRMTKSLLNQSRDGLSLRQQIELENRTQVLLTTIDDFTEGTQALRRAPPRGLPGRLMTEQHSQPDPRRRGPRRVPGATSTTLP